jgi:tetratricopeptide (TPR) repeat protein
MKRLRLVRGFAVVLFGAVVVCYVLATSSHPVRADVLDEAWKQGNAAYLAGDWEKAAAAFDQLDRQGVVSADLYYNMGVSYFRLGNLGRAAWSFERSAGVDPKDDDAAFNLAQVRKLLARRTTDKIEGSDRDTLWIRVVSAMTASTQTWLFVIFYLLTFWFLFWRLRIPSDSRAPWSAVTALAGIAAALAGVLLLGRVALDRIPFAIVLPESVSVREGADANYRTTFEIHAGLRVRLLEQDGAWARVRLANGLEGWVRDQDVGKL